MGNATSGSCSRISDSVNLSSIRILKKTEKSNRIAMLLDTSGNIREMKLPVKSGELMIEEMGHVITPVDDLRRTRRISALRADEELVAGKVYLLVPVSRVHSKASEFELAIAEKWGVGNESGQRKKQSSGKMAKVSPSQVSTLRERTQREGGRETENEVGMLIEQFVCPRQGNLARWNPVLDPIFESSRELGQQL